MIRVVTLSGKTYGKCLDTPLGRDDLEDIREFVESGEPVVLVDALEDLENIPTFDPDSVIMPEEEE